jgi:hypothetical protein
MGISSQINAHTLRLTYRLRHTDRHPKKHTHTYRQSTQTHTKCQTHIDGDTQKRRDAHGDTEHRYMRAIAKGELNYQRSPPKLVQAPFSTQSAVILLSKSVKVWISKEAFIWMRWLPCFYICTYETIPRVKNAVFWDKAPCRSCVNRRFAETYRLCLQSTKIR